MVFCTSKKEERQAYSLRQAAESYWEVEREQGSGDTEARCCSCFPMACSTDRLDVSSNTFYKRR